MSKQPQPQPLPRRHRRPRSVAASSATGGAAAGGESAADRHDPAGAAPDVYLDPGPAGPDRGRAADAGSRRPARAGGDPGQEGRGRERPEPAPPAVRAAARQRAERPGRRSRTAPSGTPWTARSRRVLAAQPLVPGGGRPAHPALAVGVHRRAAGRLLRGPDPDVPVGRRLHRGPARPARVRSLRPGPEPGRRHRRRVGGRPGQPDTGRGDRHGGRPSSRRR